MLYSGGNKSIETIKREWPQNSLLGISSHSYKKLYEVIPVASPLYRQEHSTPNSGWFGGLMSAPLPVIGDSVNNWVFYSTPLTLLFHSLTLKGASPVLDPPGVFKPQKKQCKRRCCFLLLPAEQILKSWEMWSPLGNHHQLSTFHHLSLPCSPSFNSLNLTGIALPICLTLERIKPWVKSGCRH